MTVAGTARSGALRIPRSLRGMRGVQAGDEGRTQKPGKWAMCRLISLDAHSDSKPIGPPGACTAAGWSPDGSWMYFIAAVEGRSHLWRQRYPNSQPEQLIFGPTEEEGLAVAHDGRSLITSMGAKGSAIWIHDEGGERALSSEGEVDQDTSPPTFSVDGKNLYYLLRRRSSGVGAEL
jgi:WD40-like Beta Propeller Repeat